jgi:hypothetical protein
LRFEPKDAGENHNRDKLTIAVLYADAGTGARTSMPVAGFVAVTFVGLAIYWLVSNVDSLPIRFLRFLMKISLSGVTVSDQGHALVKDGIPVTASLVGDFNTEHRRHSKLAIKCAQQAW